MKTKRNILFVDDEQNILDGLKRMLRSMRKELNMHFAESGAAALEMMETNVFDVIVTDMRMPGIDGARLLNEVKQKYPHTIRIMLTGQADEESILRTLGVTHQFLTKPCDPGVLKTVIHRSCSLHDLLSNGALKNLISGIGSLPSLPALYAKLQEALRKPDVSTDEIGMIIEEDIAMSAKVLQLVNSSFFGLLKRVETPGRAVKLLGLDTMKVLVLSLQVFSELKPVEEIIPIEILWSHSVAVANCAKIVAKEASKDQDMITNAFIAGLLHDIGKLVMLSKMSTEYKKVINLSEEQGVTLFEAEKRVFGATHNDIGAYLVGLWGFNGSIVEAIGFQNRLQEYPSGGFSAALAVHVANTAFYKVYPKEICGPAVELNEEYLAHVGMADQVGSWQDACEKYLISTD